jgi:RNA polymerase sigma factor (sigma-70 family)
MSAAVETYIHNEVQEALDIPDSLSPAESVPESVIAVGEAALSGATEEIATDEVSTPDVYDEDPQTTDLVQLYLSQLKEPLLNREQETELSKTIEAGLFAQKILEVRSGEFTLGSTKNAKNLQKSIESYAHVSEEDLLEIYEQGRAAKDRMITANLRLVVSIAKKYQFRGITIGMPLLDIIQEGNIGLNHAVEKFDYTKGYKLSTYATIWIRQHIEYAMAHGRMVRLPREKDDQLGKHRKAKDRLRQSLGSEPTVAELATELNITEEHVETVARWGTPLLSLNGPLGGEGDSGEIGDVIVPADQPDEIGETVAQKDIIQRIFDDLSEEETFIITRSYGLHDGKCWSPYSIARAYKKKYGGRCKTEIVLGIQQEALSRVLGEFGASMSIDDIRELVA